MDDQIIIRGARQHNLKNINVEIPKNSLTAITGLSGSGKSTLAFDTLYAEGHRRYVESLSTYARQFLGQMDKPDVDAIIGLSPAISIEQKTTSNNPRSTVGTVTEIYDYLRLLFARVGKVFCHQCKKPISFLSIDQITDKILAFENKTKIQILSPLVHQQKGAHQKLLGKLKKEGFARARINGQMHLLEDPIRLDKNHKNSIDAVVDRIIIKDGIENRLADSLEIALSLSSGTVLINEVDQNKDYFFSEKAACPECGISYPELTPASFSFNSPQGACPDCDGLGTVTDFDPDLIVPDRSISLRQGAVVPWQHRDSVQFMEFLDALVSHYNEDIYKPFENLSSKFQHVLLWGSKDENISFYVEKKDKKIVFKKPFEGIIPMLKGKYTGKNSGAVKSSVSMPDDVKRLMSSTPCPSCNGTRINDGSRSVEVGGKKIFEITAMPIQDTISFFNSLTLDKKDQHIAANILKEIIDRLGFLLDVGLDYLSLNRSALTLSGGESQRIRLATQIGSKLTGVLYVLDEPSIGLHQKDNARLLGTLMNLKNLGNTVLMVEHDDNAILAADHVIDVGPGAGINGGQIVFSGSIQELLKSDISLTGLYLSGKKKIHQPHKRRQGSGHCISVQGACSNNLKHIDVSFPLGCLTCVSGVSGSGKSTLVFYTLYQVLANRLHHTRKPTGAYDKITGLAHINKVVHIDQSPIGKTPRSNPGTYTGLFNDIRELFSKTREAQMRGYKSGRFSFNVKGGRCESCRGDGIKKIEMHFLPDVYVACDVCKGKRYNRETLEIKYKGKNIAQVLDMTINQCVEFFDAIPAVKNKLDLLVQVGLGYVTLGQPGTTLSGGEAQRIKLARELSKKGTGQTIYILDEPTTGLHPDDISKLLSVLNKLVDAQNTVVIIEHNLDVIKSCDHVIDLGPEGGENGGHVVVCGTPEEVAGCNRSYTGFYLKNVLQ